MEYRGEGDGRQHGAEAVEPRGDGAPLGTEGPCAEQRRGRADGGPERRLAVGDEEPEEEEEPRDPRVDEEDLRKPLEPSLDEVAEGQPAERCHGRGQLGRRHVGGRHAVHGAGGEQEAPRAEDEGEGQRVDPPRGHHVVEGRPHPRRERGAEDERQPHPRRAPEEGREGAAHQNAVEAPEPLRAVGGREAEQPTREGRGDEAQQRAPSHEARALLVGAPEDAGEEEQSRPDVVLEHHLPGAAQQRSAEFVESAAHRGDGRSRVFHRSVVVLRAVARWPPGAQGPAARPKARGDPRPKAGCKDREYSSRRGLSGDLPPARLTATETPAAAAGPASRAARRSRRRARGASRGPFRARAPCRAGRSRSAAARCRPPAPHRGR